MTDKGETPLTTGDLADEITSRVGIVTNRSTIRKVIAEIEHELKQKTFTLGREHS